MEKQESRKRRKGKSILTIPESKKRKEPEMTDGTLYVVPTKERKIFHIEVEDKQFDPKSGKKISKPHIVKLDGTSEYKQFITNVYKSGLEYSILHDPRPYFGMSKAEMKAEDKKFFDLAGKENRKK